MSEISEASDRFWSKVQKGDGCWIWHAAKAGGYGRFWLNGKLRPAHRVAYEMLRGPIPEGLVIDHLCRQPACVNPEHMEPVPEAVNIRRGEAGLHMRAKSALITHCPQGHEYTSANTYRIPSTGWRTCLSCRRERTTQFNLNRKAG